MRVLTVLTRGRLFVPGTNPLRGPHSSFVDGGVQGICPWGSALVMRKSDGRAFWVGCGWFFWAGRGGEEKASGHVSRVGFRWTTHTIKHPQFFYVIYYILNSGNFTDACFRPSRMVPPNPRGPGQTLAVFGFRHPDDLFHALKTVKGLLHLVPPRTPRTSGYGVLCTCSLCYMLFLICI
jgi:hypothetical protein